MTNLLVKQDRLKVSIIKSTPILLSDLKKECQEDWLKDMQGEIQAKVRNGEIDLIVGYYNEGYDVAEY